MKPKRLAVTTITEKSILPVKPEPPEINIVNPSTGEKFRILSIEKIKNAVLEITPSKLTSNMNVKYLLMEFSKFFVPFDKRVHIKGGKVIVTPEFTFWWEVIIKKGQIKFYVVVPDKEYMKEALKMKIRAVWNKANVKEVKDYMPVFDVDKTDVTRMTLEKNSVMSLDVLNDINSPLEHWLQAKSYVNDKDFALLQIGMKPEGNGWNENSQHILESIKEKGTVPRKKGKKLSFKETIQQLLFLFGLLLEEVMNLLADFLIPSWEEDKTLADMRKIKVGDLSISTRKKIDSDAFKTNIRIAVQSTDSERRKSITRSIASGFRTMEGDNNLIEQKIVKTKQRQKELDRIEGRKMTRGMNDVLVTTELSKIINVPDMKAQREHYNELGVVGHRGESDVPKEVFDAKSGIAIAKYEDTDGLKKTVYLPSKKDYLCRPIVGMGGQGSGKSTLACNLALDAFNAGYGAVLVDAADGRMIKRVLDRIQPEKRDKVKIVDFTNEKWAVGLGLNEGFYGGGRHTIDLIAEEVATYIETISQTKINMTARGWLELAVRAVFTSPDATIDDVIMMMKDVDYREKVIPTIKDPELRSDWERFHTQYSKQERRTIYEQIFRRVHKLLRNETIKSIIRQKPKKDSDGKYLVDFRKWMDDGYLILVKADEALDRNQQTALISFVIAKFNLAILSRRDIPNEDDRKPCFLILDEPDHYIKGSDRWEYMLTTYRKYRCTLTFFFHTWEQLKKKVRNLPDYVRSAGSHYILMNNDEKKNFEYLKHAIEPEFKIEDIAKGMPEFHAIIRLKTGGVTPAFMAQTIEEPEKRYKKYNNDDLLDKSAEELGRSIDEVLNDIFSYSNGGEFDIGEVTSGGIVDEDVEEEDIPFYEENDDGEDNEDEREAQREEEREFLRERVRSRHMEDRTMRTFRGEDEF